MRCGASMSLEAQTGQSEEIHSPEEWASRVVRWMWPVACSTQVLWIVAISFER